MKILKRTMIGCAVFVVIFMFTWCICEIGRNNYYNYKGYVVDISEEDGETVIVTLNGNTESQFTLKWYTRKKYEKDEKSIEIGDRIKLSTTHYSDTNIKKLSVDHGKSLEGKIFYIESPVIPERPFLFVNDPLYGTHIFELFTFDEHLFEGMNTGDTVRVYYESSQMDAAVKISDGAYEDFTDAEKTYIAELGYTVKEPTE